MRTSIQLSCPTRATFFMYIMALGLLMVSRLRFPSILGHRFYSLVHRSQFCLLCWELYPLWAFHLLYILVFGYLSLLLVLNYLTGRPGIRNSSAMLILIADTLHLLGRGYEAPLSQTCTHGCTHTHIQKICTERGLQEIKGGYTDSWRGWNTQRWVDGKSKRTREQREERWNGKTQRTKKHIEQEKGKKMAQERQKGHVEERNPRWRVETAERRPESEIGKMSN